MKKRIIAYSAGAAAILFSFALIENKTQVGAMEFFSVSNIESTAKNIVRPMAYAAGVLKEPVVVQRSDFIDRDRFFEKTLTDDGRVVMSEVAGGPILHYFNEGSGLLIEGDHDVILERFNGTSTDRKIVFNRLDDSFPINLLKMLAAVVKHGGLDDANPYEQSLDILRTRSLSMTCGTVSAFAQRLLDDIGVRSRVITTLTLEEWNTYDNGHTFLEVYIPKSKTWVAIDLDTKVFFSAPTIDRASLRDMMAAGVDQLTFTSFIDASSLDYSTFKKYQAIAEYATLNKKEWYGRVLQVFALRDAKTGKYVFATDDEVTARRVASYSSEYTTLPVTEFVKHFYGGN